MPYNTKNIITDALTKPVPQHFNTTTDQYEVATGSDGAIHTRDIGAQGAVSVTPNDSADLATNPTKGIYVGVSGDVKMTLKDGTTITFKVLSGGMIHSIAAKRIWATGTTATNILALY